MRIQLVDSRVSSGWCCPNLDCPAQIRERLQRWCSRDAMDIRGADEALIAQLVKQGLAQDVADLYSLGVGEVANLANMTEPIARNFLDSVVASKKRDLERLIFGLGIPDVDARIVKSLACRFATLDAIQAASLRHLSEVEGVGPAVATSLVRWFKDSFNRRLIEKLRDAGLNFRSEIYRR